MKTASPRIGHGETIPDAIERAGSGDTILFGFDAIPEGIVIKVNHGDIVAGANEARKAIVRKLLEGGAGGDAGSCGDVLARAAVVQIVSIGNDCAIGIDFAGEIALRVPDKSVMGAIGRRLQHTPVE